VSALRIDSHLPNSADRYWTFIAVLVVEIYEFESVEVLMRDNAKLGRFCGTHTGSHGGSYRIPSDLEITALQFNAFSVVRC
jgi:hypothetical protein